MTDYFISGYEYLSKHLRIVFSFVHLKVKEKLYEKEPNKMLLFTDFEPFVQEKFREALENVRKMMYDSGEPATVIRSKFFPLILKTF